MRKVYYRNILEILKSFLPEMRIVYESSQFSFKGCGEGLLQKFSSIFQREKFNSYSNGNVFRSQILEDISTIELICQKSVKYFCDLYLKNCGLSHEPIPQTF
jgi:hypothetical protein